MHILISNDNRLHKDGIGTSLLAYSPSVRSWSFTYAIWKYTTNATNHSHHSNFLLLCLGKFSSVSGGVRTCT